mmetsp:Transcript_5710/g.4873  ORF Transcript_5710/g.4873 Transcript_5710/m.4873 type:complete len:100 (-) Transcript_5710:1647-1946(-)
MKVGTKIKIKDDDKSYSPYLASGNMAQLDIPKISAAKNKNSGDIGFHSALADSLTKSPRKSPFGKKKSEGIQIGEATPVASRKTSEDFSSAIDEEQQEP